MWVDDDDLETEDGAALLTEASVNLDIEAAPPTWESATASSATWA